jgi:uncharacterized protein (DUF2267 family)
MAAAQAQAPMRVLLHLILDLLETAVAQVALEAQPEGVAAALVDTPDQEAKPTIRPSQLDQVVAVVVEEFQ